MNRGWFLLLAIMVGLNTALLYDKFARPSEPVAERGRGRPGVNEPRWRDMEPAERTERMIERELNRMTEQLGLDEAQRERLRRIKTASFAELTPLRESTRDKRHEIRRLLQAATLDSARIYELGASLREELLQLETVATRNFVQEAAVLTPEQRAKYLTRRSFGPPGHDRGGDRRRMRRPSADELPPPGPEGP